MLFASRIARAIRCCSAVLAVASLIIPIALAQAPGAGLTITILDGDEATNNIRQRTAREPIVQVEDENHKPVAGAAVIFLLPNDGAGGTFAGGARTLTTVTDSKGQAVARGLHPNHTAGRFQIKVQATHEGKSGQTTISQVNMLAAASAAGSSAVPKWVSAVIVGAVAATVVAVGTHGGSGASPSSNVPVAVISEPRQHRPAPIATRQRRNQMYKLLFLFAAAANLGLHAQTTPLGGPSLGAMFSTPKGRRCGPSSGFPVLPSSAIP